MHTPPWLLNILVSYLSNRSMILEYDGHQSRRKILPGGGPQGAYLGGLIFIVKFNGAFLRPPVPRYLATTVPKANSKSVKFIDDGTVAVSINMKTSLAQETRMKMKPLDFNERTCQVLPTNQNVLQHYLDEAEIFTKENGMKINSKKTKVIKFNKSTKHDFPPEM